MYIDLTGYEVYIGSKENLIHKIDAHLSEDNNSKLNIISGNPEVLFNGLNDDVLNDYFNRKESIIIPDGIGVTILLKFLRKCSVNKIAGIEIMEEILKISDKNSLKVYFLGTTQANISLAVNNISNKYPNIDVCGFDNGYFCEQNLILQKIMNASPDILFVAMGSPKQDYFINYCLDKVDCKIFMGVGGSFDLYAGKLNRAPEIMIKFGLEWFYRVYKEPFRIKRLSSIPKFMMASFKYYLKDR